MSPRPLWRKSTPSQEAFASPFPTCQLYKVLSASPVHLLLPFNVPWWSFDCSCDIGAWPHCMWYWSPSTGHPAHSFSVSVNTGFFCFWTCACIPFMLLNCTCQTPAHMLLQTTGHLTALFTWSPPPVFYGFFFQPLVFCGK